MLIGSGDQRSPVPDAAWRYVDDRRTHEVRVEVVRDPRPEMVVRELAIGATRPEDAYEERHLLTGAWETKAHTLALEARLTLLGNYYRSVPGGWAPVRVASPRPLDLRPLPIEPPTGIVEFHHFNGPAGKHAATLVGLHTDTPEGRRTMLARLDYPFPYAEGGQMQVVHHRLPAAVYRSVLAMLHLEMESLRFEKMSHDSAAILARRTWAALQTVLDAILARLVEGRLEAARSQGATSLGSGSLATLQALRASRGAASAARTFDVDEEMGPDAKPVHQKKTGVTMEELPDDVLHALRDPKLQALHDRMLAPGEEARLIDAGQRLLVEAMREKRETTKPHEQHLVSILEASLLLRQALAKRSRIDPEVLTRVKHAGAYLG